MKKTGEKRGQVTIFIILAIIIVAGVIIFLLLRGPTVEPGRTPRFGFEGCIQDAVEADIKELALSAGYINPESYFMYQGSQIPYLCYTNEYYQTCVVQNPFLVNHFNEQIKRVLREKVNTCYENSINELRDQGYDVASGSVEMEVFAEPGVFRVEVEAPTRVEQGSYSRFNIQENNDIYEILMIATSILQYEASYGDSDVDSLMFLYPEFIIDKLKQGDGTTIYIITSKDYGTEFKFASKSLVWPPGYHYD